MKERPILFNGEMVRAILEGQKTQTRRVIKPQPRDGDTIGSLEDWASNLAIHAWPSPTTEEFNRKVEQLRGKVFPFIDRHGHQYSPVCKYGRPRDELWVKEGHFAFGRWTIDGKTKTGKHKQRFIIEKNCGSMLDDSPPSHICTNRAREIGWWKRNSLFMPRWASRIQLVIKDVRVERVQEITVEDMEAEGVSDDVQNCPCCGDWECIRHEGVKVCEISEVDAFRRLWDSINEKRGFGWDKNPWVWVVEFEVKI